MAKCFRTPGLTVTGTVGPGLSVLKPSPIDPAKFSRSLIQRIYQHARAEGWLPPGSVVVDCFGGVSLGALDACLLGCTHVAVELEPRFHLLALQNKALWDRKYGHLPGYGEAVCLQGDSRQLGEVLSKADVVVSSPPYADRCSNDNQRTLARNGLQQGHNEGDGTTYGDTPGNLAAMVVGSPPFGASLSTNPSAQILAGSGGRMAASCTQPDGYGSTPGNLGTLPSGEVQAVITSPVYPGCVHDGNGIDPTKLTGNVAGVHSQAKAEGYGQTPGQLGRLPEGRVQAVVSSPPWDGGAPALVPERQRVTSSPKDHGGPGPQYAAMATLGEADTFWSAARTILTQCSQVLPPGGHAIFVVKAYVKAGQLVDFPGQWAALCQAVGFQPLHTHHALLTTDHGTELGLFGGETVRHSKRVSFFRRLHEAKRPDLAIDYEVVQCFGKP